MKTKAELPKEDGAELASSEYWSIEALLKPVLSLPYCRLLELLDPLLHLEDLLDLLLLLLDLLVLE